MESFYLLPSPLQGGFGEGFFLHFFFYPLIFGDSFFQHHMGVGGTFTLAWRDQGGNLPAPKSLGLSGAPSQPVLGDPLFPPVRSTLPQKTNPNTQQGAFFSPKMASVRGCTAAATSEAPAC